MALTAANASVYTDLHSLQKLKSAARENSPQALREVAQQFEALFFQIALKSMRAASLGGGAFDSEQSEFYQELFDRQLALELAKRGELGLADILTQQLTGAGARPRSAIAQDDLPRVPGRIVPPVAEAQEPVEKPAAMPAIMAPAPSGTFKPCTPEAFVRHMWPHAQEAARRLGQSPDVLIAQAALESGWGRSVPRASGGHSSHNLFGIKADRSWDGPRVVNSTLEFIDGVPVRRRDGFRAYGSYAESFNDYVAFLKRNPRYRHALQQQGDSVAYIRAIHRAGYATDPSYAAKVEDILNGPVLQNALDGLKIAASEPILSKEG